MIDSLCLQPPVKHFMASWRCSNCRQSVSCGLQPKTLFGKLVKGVLRAHSGDHWGCQAFGQNYARIFTTLPNGFKKFAFFFS